MSRYINADSFIADTQKQYCKDCEHRKGMKNGKYQFIYEIGGVRCRSCDIGDMINAVDDYYPAADVAPVIHGHWIYDDRNLFHCSKCGAPKLIERPFCSHCGAKMDERED